MVISLQYVLTLHFYRFEHMQKDIQKAVKKPFYPTKCDVEVNGYYLAKDPEGDDYCRIKVTSLEKEKADCFYVDYGDQHWNNVSNIIFLSDELITQLPFQVIECRLFGVKPVLDCWSPEANDMLYEYCFEPNTDYFRTLYTKIHKIETPRLTQGSKYAVLLIDTINSKPTLVNNVIIDCGIAIGVDSEDLNVEILLSKVNTDEKEENEEEEIEEIRAVQSEQETETDEDDGLDRTIWDFQVFDIKKIWTGKQLEVCRNDGDVFAEHLLISSLSESEINSALNNQKKSPDLF